MQATRKNSGSVLQLLMSQRRGGRAQVCALAVVCLLTLGYASAWGQSAESESQSETLESESTVPIIPSEDDSVEREDEQGEEHSPASLAELDLQPTLDQILELAKTGTPQLAQALLEQTRASYEGSDDWLEWESVYLEIAFDLKNYQDIVTRVAQLDQVVDYEFFVKMHLAAARAEFELGRFTEARTRLRNLIWNLPYDQDNMIIWRDWIARSYANEGLLADAATALTGYYRDYRPSEPQWEYRYARALTLNGQYEQALSRLEPLQTLESKVLKLYGQLKLKQMSPIEIQQAALRLEPELSDSPQLLAELWAIIGLNAKSMKDFEMQVIAIENGLSVAHDRESEFAGYAITPLSTVEDLMNAYDDYALQVGNEFNLVVGDDASWNQLAFEFEITSVTTARAIYSFLARQTSDTELRKSSIASLGMSLASEGLVQVVEALFIDDQILPLASLPPGLQNGLANRAIRSQNYATALTIMNAMQQPEEEQDIRKWLLRRARLAIFLGQFELSASLVDEAIDRLSYPLAVETLDQLKQVLFDMQEKGEHNHPVFLFQRLYGLTDDIQAKRELLRWVADSLSARNELESASEILMRSASLGNNWNDEWGRSARLKAADELTLAGYHSDARRIYTQLEKDTYDPRAKAVIIDRLKNLPLDN